MLNRFFFVLFLLFGNQLVSQLDITNVNVIPNRCDASSDIEVSITGGTSPYTYILVDSVTGNINASFSSGNLLDSFHFIANNEVFNVIVEDNLGLTDTVYGVRTNNMLFTQLSLLATDITHTDPTVCQNNDATITISTPSNGRPPFEYSINGTTWQSNGTFTALTDGVYKIYVRDSCSNVDSNFSETILPFNTSVNGLELINLNTDCDNITIPNTSSLSNLSQINTKDPSGYTIEIDSAGVILSNVSLPFTAPRSDFRGLTVITNACNIRYEYYSNTNGYVRFIDQNNFTVSRPDGCRTRLEASEWQNDYPDINGGTEQTWQIIAPAAFATSVQDSNIFDNLILGETYTVRICDLTSNGSCDSCVDVNHNAASLIVQIDGFKRPNASPYWNSTANRDIYDIYCNGTFQRMVLFTNPVSSGYPFYIDFVSAPTGFQRDAPTVIYSDTVFGGSTAWPTPYYYTGSTGPGWSTMPFFAHTNLAPGGNSALDSIIGGGDTTKGWFLPGQYEIRVRDTCGLDDTLTVTLNDVNNFPEYTYRAISCPGSNQGQIVFENYPNEPFAHACGGFGCRLFRDPFRYRNDFPVRAYRINNSGGISQISIANAQPQSNASFYRHNTRTTWSYTNLPLGTYIVTHPNSFRDCIIRYDTIEIEEYIPMSIRWQEKILCSDSSDIIFHMQNGTAPYTFTVTDVNGMVYGPTTNPGFRLINGVHNVTISDNCGQSITQSFSLNLVGFSTFIADTNYCIGDSITVFADSINGGTYTWTGPNGFTSNQRIVTINPFQASNIGWYNMSSNGGCFNASTSFYLGDSIAPQIYCKDTTIYMGANGQFVIDTTYILDSIIENHPCGIDSIWFDSVFTCMDTGLVSRNIYARDAFMNVDSCTFNVRVFDTNSLSISCKNDTLYLDAIGMAVLDTTHIFDSISSSCAIDSIWFRNNDTLFNCSDIGSLSVTLYVLTYSGSLDSCTSTLTILDTIAPTIICQNANAYLDSFGIARWDTSGLINSISDNCGVDSVWLNIDSTMCSVNTMIAMVYAMDASGNVDSCQSTINILDTINPSVNCHDSSVYIDANGIARWDTSYLINSLYDNCNIDSVWLGLDSATCVSTNVTTQIYIRDSSGNIDSCQSMITIIDTIAPTASCVSTLTVHLSQTGTARINTSDIDNGSFDNCIIQSMVLSDSTFDCNDIGNNSVTLIVRDQSGNVDSCMTIVTVIDTNSPMAICQNITVQLDANGQVSILPTQIDNGSSHSCNTPVLSLSDSSFTCDDIGANTVTLYATINGMVDSCTATVTVEDIQNPMLTCPPTQIDTTVANNCSYTIPDYTSLISNIDDNCNSANVQISQSPAAGSIVNINGNPVDSITISITATDNSGNQANCSFTQIIICSKELRIPEFISPNGNGKNDKWVIEGISQYPENEVKIFNRWGALVYDVKGYNNVWEGKGNGGGELPSGTYFYVLELNDLSQKVHTGYIQIQR